LGPKTEGGDNWDITNRVKSILETRGYKVVLTKNSAEENPDLPARVALANGSNARAFVSIHSNSDGGTGPIGIIYCQHSGVLNDGQVNYADDSACPQSGLTEQSKTLSHNILNNIKTNLGLSPERFWGGDLGVLTNLKMPAALIEMFAHDQQSDLDKINGKEDTLAKSIADGIIQSMNGK
jgi:N-acetylmuramoyl-L-alanine amidase